MRITHIIRRGRKGTASLFGTLIFIGILFSAVIPMYLVMNQADTIFEQRKHETNQLDEERTRENLLVFVYPTGDAAPHNLTVKVKNECEFSVKVVRVWVNSIIWNVSKVLDPVENIDIGSFDVNPTAGSSFDIRVTTERGNVFESGSGSITYDGFNWDVENLFINVLVSSSGVVFKIHIYELVDSNWVEMIGPPVSSPATVWKIGGSAFKAFDITSSAEGFYKVEVKRGSQIIYEEEVEMKWPQGPSVIWVYA